MFATTSARIYGSGKTAAGHGAEVFLLFGVYDEAGGVSDFSEVAADAHPEIENDHRIALAVSVTDFVMASKSRFQERYPGQRVN